MTFRFVGLTAVQQYFEDATVQLQQPQHVIPPTLS